jgi:hypothetical protein
MKMTTITACIMDTEKAKFAEWLRLQGYASYSEAIRALVRQVTTNGSACQEKKGDFDESTTDIH